MATTDIHAITQTVGAAIGYVTSDKTEITIKDDISDSINYAMNDKTGEVTYFTLSSTLNCSNPQEPTEDFKETIKTFGQREIEYGNMKTKDGKPILAWHLVQSFEGEVDPRIANEIGVKLAKELFGNHQVVISTHTNTQNTHNHFIICAWDLDGKKYNYDHSAYDAIRETSDRLCDEYGLSVIEETRDRKLVKWTDKDGEIRYFEPTDRKIDLSKKRKEGEISEDDVNSYRNTIPYQISEAKKQTNVEMVKQAIDSKLPFAKSFDHLLFMLREEGFRIKDKKKNGEWMAHITYIPPTASKGVRDYTIDRENNFYSRENLTAVIEGNTSEERLLGMQSIEANVPYYESYEYGEIDVQGINEDYRAVKTDSGVQSVIKRGEVEQSVIRSIKQSDRELYGLYDTTRLHQLIKEQKVARKNNVSPVKREEILVRQIQDSFDTLRFIESKQIYSYKQINEVVKGLWGQYNACLVKLDEAEMMVERLDSITKAPLILSEVVKKMEQRKNDPEYMIEKYPQDAKLMKSCMEAMKKNDATTPEGLKSLQTSIEKYSKQIDSLKTSLLVFSNELASYDRCMGTLSRIDAERGRDNDDVLMEYKNITNEGAKEAEKTNEKRRKNDWDR